MTFTNRVIVSESIAILSAMAYFRICASVCLDKENNLMTPGTSGFSCTKECSTCFNCSCSKQGILIHGIDCTRDICPERPCLKDNGELVPSGTRGFSCKLDCNSCSDCGCARNGTIIPGGTCTHHKCTEKSCIDEDFRIHAPNSSGFACMDESNHVCSSCLCSPKGIIIPGKCVLEEVQDKGCQGEDDHVYPPHASGFPCRSACNVCSSCSCSANGTTIPGGECTTQSCSHSRLDNVLVEEVQH